MSLFKQTVLGYECSLLKGTHTIYFSSSLYIINQKPMIPRIHNVCFWPTRYQKLNNQHICNKLHVYLHLYN